MFKSMTEKQRNSVVGGIGLILIGLLIFIAQLNQNVAMGWLITGGLALIFLIWGILTRQSGFFIPAGILGGVAVGIFLTMSTTGILVKEQVGALMLLSLAGGFAAISVLSLLFTRVSHWWALVVAAILGFIGVALWFGGAAMNLLMWVGQAWPLILVIIGIGILWQVWRGKTA
jgi:hypothetical protein